MTAVEIPRGIVPSERAGSVEVGRWGMLLFLVNEATLFGCLVTSYFYIGFHHATWPPAGVAKPTLQRPLIMTALLVSSSVVLVIAESFFKRRRTVGYRVGVLVTVALGASFLAMQVLEYREKLTRLHPSDNSYASLFYTITGLHGTHVAFGMLVLLWAMAREIAGTAPPPRSLAVKNSSLYWHFVDAVWLVILTSLYISPRF
jgi:heme/copper-type cytochrome/quinol oxidase subunit 3